MKKNYLAALVLIAVSAPALAQTDHQQHHPGGTTAPQAQAQPQAPAPTQPQGQIPMMGQAGPQSEATKAYMAAMDKMHGPMTQASRTPILTSPLSKA